MSERSESLAEEGAAVDGGAGTARRAEAVGRVNGGSAPRSQSGQASEQVHMTARGGVCG